MIMKNTDFKHGDWIVQWAHNWSILSFSYWGNFYCRNPFSEDVDTYVNQTMILSHQGNSFAYQRRSEKKIFSRKLEKIIENDDSFPQCLVDNLKSASDDFLKLVDKYISRDISFKQYEDFQNALVNKYYPYHVEIKVVVDFLKPELLEKFLPVFEEARVYAESVFIKSEEFMMELARIHSKKTGYAPELILSTLKDEFTEYFKGGKLPPKGVLQNRYEDFAYLFNEKDTFVFVGDEVKDIEHLVQGEAKHSLVKGQIAYAGKATGKVRVVLDVNKVAEFDEGDILIAGMTRPDYLPFMKKAVAFVTDGGGILCHAAILARELKKPCVIGTEVATTVFKDGDMVEVDAEKGIVRKIN